MSWLAEWSALSARIRGVTEAAEFFFRTMAVRATDSYAVLAHSLLPQTRDIHAEIAQFAARNETHLPTNARDCVRRFLETRPEVFSDSNINREPAIQFRITALAAFRSEFGYHIADVLAHAKRQSERAFTHIQRSIVVEEVEREKWQAAFDAGEVACERLGSIRLLAHGIWAFKVDSLGERTDLVLQERLRVAGEVERVADALVLTEWKVCSDASNVSSKIAEAKSQVRRYRAGSLAGLELMSYRYIVIVSRTHVSLPSDDVQPDATYRHLNIAVAPVTPSVDSRVGGRLPTRSRRSR